MIIKIKKYVAKVVDFVEHEDGTISKEVKEIVLKGQRFTPASVERHIPRGTRLLDSGWKETAYEIDSEKLEQFLTANGKPVTAENAE